MFIFDNLLALDDRSMQTLLRSVENPLLVAALKGADERMRTKMLSAMSQRAAQTVQDEIEGRGPMRVSEVQDAQKRILAIARQLGESGAIMLGGSGDDYRSEEHTSELQSLMRISYAVFCLKKKKS